MIQDSVLLRRAHPDHVVWKHQLFALPAYCAFASQMEKLQAGGNQEILTTVQAALPILSNVVSSGLGSVGFRLSAIESALQGISVDINKILNGRLQFVTRDEPNSTPCESDSCNSDTVPQYRMARGLRTIDEVWMEYDVGLLQAPSVKSLEARHGAKWRSEVAERQFFSRRKVLYDAIEALACEQMVPGAAVAHALEQRRRESKRSLDSFIKLIRVNGARAVMDGKM